MFCNLVTCEIVANPANSGTLHLFMYNNLLRILVIGCSTWYHPPSMKDGANRKFGDKKQKEKSDSRSFGVIIRGTRVFGLLCSFIFNYLAAKLQKR